MLVFSLRSGPRFFLSEVSRSRSGPWLIALLVCGVCVWGCECVCVGVSVDGWNGVGSEW